MNLNQLQLLQLIGTQGATNLLKARTKLSWDLERFAVSLHSLETAGFISRDGFKASCTAKGISELGTFNQGKSLNSVSDDVHRTYIDEVKVPRLPTNELWLPNLENFLHSVGIRK